MKVLFFLLITVLGAGGCARMYNAPEISRDLKFSGIRDIIPPGGKARLILSHGMCSGAHTKEWAEGRLSQFAALVGAPPPVSTDVTLTDRFAGKVERYDARLIGAEGRTFDMTFLVYGRPIDAARNALQEDSGRGGDQPRRAQINSTIRDKLMNDCLVDAVFYLGPNGDAIRRDVREFWCDYLDGTVTESTGKLDEFLRCQVNSLGAASNAPVFLIPESLGSKVIFDAYRQVDVTGRTTRSEALGPVGGIHLVTNQVLLLDQAGIASNGRQVSPQGRSSDTDGFISPSLDAFLFDTIQAPSLRSLSADIAPFGVPVVAYTDPNDALGYRLLPDGDFDRLTIVNVLLSNTGSFLPGVPIIANPIDAHTGAGNQSAIFEMILDGSDRVSSWDE